VTAPGRSLAALAALALAGCAAPPPAAGVTIADATMTRAMAGAWEWRHSTTAGGVRTDERERWELAPTADWLTLAGHYQRTVVVTAVDGVPFPCLQRPRYSLASTVAVTVTAAPGGAQIVETSYQAAPSPCDRGLRRLARYHAAPRRRAAGSGVGRRPGDANPRRPEVPAPSPPVAAAPAGPWAWSTTSWTVDGRVQREDEAWELTVGDDGALAGWYQRTVEVRDPRGEAIACAGGPGYRYVDRYLVRGARQPDADERGDWRFAEVAADAALHPCLAANPTRAIDGATIDVVGDALVLTWRGARRQVLTRPPAYSSEYAGL
jgi:hypothetical protein